MPIAGEFHTSGIWGIRKWQFVILRGSRKLKPISRGSGLEYFWGVSISDLNSILNFFFIEKNFFRIFFGNQKNNMIRIDKIVRKLTKLVLKTTRYRGKHIIFCKKFQNSYFSGELGEWWRDRGGDGVLNSNHWGTGR